MSASSKKSLIFILLVLAAALVVFYMVWRGDINMVEQSNLRQKGHVPLVESSNVAGFDKEFDQSLKLYDSDLTDLNKLENDSSVNAISNGSAL